MRSSRQQSLVTDGINLDPFLDIVASCVGGIFFIVVLTGLIGTEAKGKITTPVLSRGDTRPVIFECRRGTILRPGLEDLRRRVQQEWDATEAKGILAWTDKVTLLEQSRIENEFYTFEPAYDLSFPNGEIRQSMYVTFEPKMNQLGEGVFVLSRPDSKFRQELASLNPSEHHVFFFVDTESFEEFHTARQIAREAGFKVGWNPNAVGEVVRYRVGGVIDTGSHF